MKAILQMFKGVGINILKEASKKALIHALRLAADELEKGETPQTEKE